MLIPRSLNGVRVHGACRSPLTHSRAVAGKIRRQPSAKTKIKAIELFGGAVVSARTFRLLIVLNGRFYELLVPRADVRTVQDWLELNSASVLVL